MIFKNSNPIIVISGGSSGIGLSISNFLLAKKFNVVNIDKKKYEKTKINFKYLKCDISKTKDIINKTKILFKEKNIAGLINCAGTTISDHALNYSLKNWHLTLAVNLTASFLLSQIISKVMIKNKTKGSIINISSISAKVAMPNNPAYNASKAALTNLTKSFAVDLAKYKIRVNSISPGYTNTPLNLKSWRDKKLRAKRSNKTLMKRWALANEYNEALLFLLDNRKSSYMTGSNITIDGGWTSKGL